MEQITIVADLNSGPIAAFALYLILIDKHHNVVFVSPEAYNAQKVRVASHNHDLAQIEPSRAFDNSRGVIPNTYRSKHKSRQR